MEQLIRVEDLTKLFEKESSSFWKREYAAAVDHVSFQISQGETMGLLGESGCGKSTLARMLSGLIEPTAGEIYYKGKMVTGQADWGRSYLRKEIQMVFQNPFASLDPRMKIRDVLLEPLNLWKIGDNRTDRLNRVKEMCAECGLEADTLEKRATEFSGGQLQRISIARALLTQPHFLVADEIVSALDVSIQSQILRLLDKMKEKYGLTVLFITHDLSVVRTLCDQVMVMQSGKLVDKGSCELVLDNPSNEYVMQLKNAAFPLGKG